MRFTPHLFLTLLLCFSFTACKKTYRDIGHEPEMMAEIDAFIEEMAAISEAFPKEIKPLPDHLDPPLRYFDTVGCNAVMVETYQLRFIDSDVGFADKDYFRLGTTRKVRRILESRHDGQKEAPEDYQQQLETILQLQYIVAVYVSYVKPTIVDKETYTGGNVFAKVAVYDRKSSSWLGGFECQAKPEAKVEFKTTKDGFFERDGLYAIKSACLANLMPKIRAGLESISDSQSLEEPAEAPVPVTQ